MVISVTEALKKLEAKIGYKVGNGMCGSLASQMLEYVAGYSFDGEEAGANDDNSIEPFAPGADMTSSWSVYTTTDWAKIGYEYINNPTLAQLKAGDIFFISPASSGIWSGHSGIVLRVSNGIVETLEQNVDTNGDGIGEQWVRKFQSNSGQGSWAWFKGFGGIVRKKEVSNPPADNSQNNNNNSENSNNKPIIKGDEEEMMLFKIVDTTGAHKGKWFISNGTHLRYIRTPRMLASYQNQFAKMNLKTDSIYSSELFGKKGEFDEKNVIW
jgi:hypothetical protein